MNRSLPAWARRILARRIAQQREDVLRGSRDVDQLDVTLCDHEAIGDAWERANGKVSIVGLLIDQLTSRAG